MTLLSVLQQQDAMHVEKRHGRYDPISQICPTVHGGC